MKIYFHFTRDRDGIAVYLVRVSDRFPQISSLPCTDGARLFIEYIPFRTHNKASVWKSVREYIEAVTRDHTIDVILTNPDPLKGW